jgi:hypothetical protein
VIPAKPSISKNAPAIISQYGYSMDGKGGCHFLPASERLRLR